VLLRVTEACEYIIEWRTAYACPLTVSLVLLLHCVVPYNQFCSIKTFTLFTCVIVHCTCIRKLIRHIYDKAKLHSSDSSVVKGSIIE